MCKQDNHTSKPLIGQIAKYNQGHTQHMMQGKLIVIAFLSDKWVDDEAGEMLAEFDHVEQLYGIVGLVEV